MNRRRATCLTLLIACAAAGPTTAPATAPAAAGQVANPLYGPWAKLKPGSSAVWSAKITVRPGQTLTATNTATLKAVTADEATVEVVVDGGPAMGGQHTDTLHVPARVDAADAVAKGHRTVTAMGKSFECDVYDTDPEKLMRSDRSGRKGSPRGELCAAADATGGLVSLSAKVGGGEVAITLTKADVK